MDNNVIISSRGKSSTAQSVMVGIAVIIIGILALIVFVPTLTDTSISVNLLGEIFVQAYYYQTTDKPCAKTQGLSN